MFIDFREESGEGGEREREKETSIGCLSYAPAMGIKPATLGMCLDWGGYQTCSLLMCGVMLQSTKPPGHAKAFFSPSLIILGLHIVFMNKHYYMNKLKLHLPNAIHWFY